jgi:ABC-2 type transport system ATP-binding protein/lipopolysaccharide transport system ATP-binding protein
MRHTDRRNSLKERIVRGRARNAEDFWAVRDVNLQIPKGSVYGLVGHNGSGKSTLLKMIGGIYRPTEGSIATDGRVAALIELGAGFHPDMTGRENIGLNGSILGLPRKEIAAVTEEIIDFSGLGDFIDDPVKHYSSGMYVRLGFSVAVHMKPDVLLIDEVLAVGDEEFQRKCFDHLYALRRSGRTIIVVSHGLGQLEGLCDEIAWLERGVMQQSGPAVETIAAYLRKVNADESARNPMVSAVRGEDDDSVRGGDQTVRVTKADIVDNDGNPISHAETGTTFQVRMGITAPEPVLGPNVRIALQHDSGALVSMISNHRWGVDFGTIQGEHVVAMGISGNPLLPGRYRVHVDVFDYTGSRLLDSWNDAVEFAVRSPRGEIGQGLVELPAEITFH